MTTFEDLTKTKGQPKQTQLTHCLQSGSDTWYYMDGKHLSGYSRIAYLGKFDGVDRFACYTHDNRLQLWKGVKGDEF